MLGVTFQPGASDLRVTLDTAEDWALIEAVVDEFGDRPPSLATLVAWLRLHPELVAINAHIEQKPLDAGMSTAVVFCCDAGPARGVGHVMRCLGARRGVGRPGYECVFVADLAESPGRRARSSARLRRS